MTITYNMFRHLSRRDMRVSRSPFTYDAKTYLVLDIQRNGKINSDISFSKLIKYVPNYCWYRTFHYYRMRLWVCVVHRNGAQQSFSAHTK
jgi:hypothetical protein